MNKLEYLKKSIELKMYSKKAWMIACFSITKSSEIIPYILKREDWGYSFINENNETIKIDNVKPNEPVFTFKERINIDNTWAINLNNPIESTIGNLLFNHICIIESFGKKIPYIEGKTSVPKIEAIISPILESSISRKEFDIKGSVDKYSSYEQYLKERNNTKIYVDEYIRFSDQIQYLSSFSQLLTYSATEKSLIPPTGLAKFKKELDIKYQGKLNDPVELAKYEEELKQFDEEFLKDDPANGTFIKDEVKNVARKKMFLSLGAEPGFKNSISVRPITNSLYEGWETEPDKFTDMMNGLRVGSYYRGADTVKGGVSAKMLLRAANNYEIKDGDCGTKLGLYRSIDKENVKRLIGRYIIMENKLILIETPEQAEQYIGKTILVRSPMYCKSQGETLCEICSGVNLNKFKTGLTIPLTEISGIILITSLKQMHGKELSTAKLILNKAIN